MDIVTLSTEMAQSAAGAAKIVFPLALGAALFEFLLLRFIKRVPYSMKQAALSLLMGLGYARAAALGGLLWGWLYFLCYEHRLFTLGLGTWWEVLLLFVLVDFFFYWQHRWAHVTRWGWASHLQHHSVEQMNMAAPFRLSVTSAVSGYQAFYAPIALIGFHPAAIVVFILINVSLQVFSHTEAVRKLGWLEWVLNTPSHHRVHHASNDIYLDKNMSGIFIVWDKLFGTFQAERDDTPTVYGLVHPIEAPAGPRLLLILWFREWAWMARDVWRAPDWKARFLYVFGPPGWKPGELSTSAGPVGEVRAAR